MAKKTKKKEERPLTEKERLVKAEMAALQAEEQRKRLEQEAKERLQQRKEKEEHYSKINSLKIHTQWRKFIRQAKVEELRKDIEILSQAHEREVDRKDAIIQMLDRDMEDAEEQYNMALRSHMQTVDALIDLQHMRVKALEEEFQSNLKALEEEFDSEKTEVINGHTRQKKDLNDMMSAMESEFAEAEGDARQEFESQREEIKNRNSEEYNVLKISLETTIEELEKHFEQAHQAYLASTDARTNSFRELTERDAASARVIEKRMRKLIRLHESLAHWRTKIGTNSREWEQRNKALREEKDMMAKHYQELKGRMSAFRAAEHERLRQLSISSGDAIKELKRKLEQAEKLLRLGELNRKLETEQEKILPFAPTYTGAIHTASPDSELSTAAISSEEALPAVQASLEPGASLASQKSLPAGLTQAMSSFAGDSISDGTDRDVVSVTATGGGAMESGEVSGGSKLSSWALDEDGNEVEEWNYLANFFRRFNKVTLDKLAIEKEKKRLAEENSQLKGMLKQYLDGISVNEEVINDPRNPLLIVNQKLQQHVAETRKERQRMLTSEQGSRRGGLARQQQNQAPELVMQYAVAS